MIQQITECKLWTCKCAFPVKYVSAPSVCEHWAEYSSSFFLEIIHMLGQSWLDHIFVKISNS